MDIKWQNGNLRVDYTERTMITVYFYDSFHDHRLSQDEKLCMLKEIIEQAMNDPDVNGSREDTSQLKFNFEQADGSHGEVQ